MLIHSKGLLSPAHIIESIDNQSPSGLTGVFAHAGAALRHMAPVLASAVTSQGRSARALYGCIVALRDHSMAAPAAEMSSAKAAERLPQKLQQCLPGALLEYAAAKIGSSAGEQSASRVGDRGKVKAGRASQEQLAEYPDGIVYDLLAAEPALLQPFVEALLASAASSRHAPHGEGVSSAPMHGSSEESRVLSSLLIGQKMLQHEQLRAALLTGKVSPGSVVSALSEVAGADAKLSDSAVAAARQKLLSLREIHFGAE